MISVTVKESKPKFFGELKDEIKNFDKWLFKTASQVRNRIHDRTLSGIDVNNNVFKPYTELTKESRQARSRATDRVTLSMFGEMLNSMKVMRTIKGAKIYFVSKAEEDKASWHNEGTGPYKITAKNKKVLADSKTGRFFGKSVNHPGLPKREFFGLSDDDIRYIDGRIKRALDGK